MGEQSNGMSELREFLKEHNMEITTLSKLIRVSRNTALRYEDNPKRCKTENRMKIELALEMIREENWVRPVIDKSLIVNVDEYFCTREAHLRDVLEFEKNFRVRFAELMDDK